MKFLEGIAHGFYSLYGAEIKNICFIVPNRRSALFFKKALSNIIKGPIISPQIIPFKDLIISLSGKREAERVELIFDLYSCYRKVVPEGDSFDKFIYHGETILKDFNEIDKYLVNEKQLFTNVKELKEIESDFSFLSSGQLKAIKSFWEGFLPIGESHSKKVFKSTWDYLLPLYKEFNKLLESKDAGYEGAIYRYVAQNSQLLDSLNKFSDVVFIGFNALNQCEKAIMKHLQTNGTADFYWDYSGRYITDRDNLASHFIDENTAGFPSKRKFDIEISDSIPSIEIIGCPSSVIQAKIGGELLKELPGTQESAVVLPDESLLLPILSSLPNHIEKINITMGYPVSGTAIFSFIKQIIELEWSDRGIYYKRVIPLLNHNYLLNAAPDESKEIVKEINTHNMIYISQSLFANNKFMELVFLKIESGEESHRYLCEKLIDILDYLADNTTIDNIEKEFVYQIRAQLTKIQSLLIPMETKSFQRILTALIEGVTIPFRGEPISGLQIMGVLETRSLDFENLIICSMNEEIFPKSSSYNSLIPYNLRVGFGLPVKESEDALYTYLFYSLISRAKKVYLLYDTRTEGLKKGEPSRFIFQLKYLYNHIAKEYLTDSKIEPHKERDRVIHKDKEIIAKLDNFLKEGSNRSISASALNDYLNCPLKFYYSHIERLSKDEEVDDTIEASDFGSIFHNTMEMIYTPYKGAEITKEIIVSLLNNKQKLEKYIDIGFKKYKNIDLPTGYSYLVKMIILRLSEIVLKYDMKLAPFIFVDSERLLLKRFSFDANRSVYFKGFIDRIDKIRGDDGELLRLVDYKTGKGDLSYSNIDSLFNTTQKKRNSVAFQMLLYSLLIEHTEMLYIEPYSVQEIAKGNESRKVISNTELEQFTDLLKELLIEIFNSEVPFSSTNNREICKWCDFNTICY